MAEELVQGKRENKDINPVEVKGYCEDTRFTVDVDKNQTEIIAYDFIDDNGGFDLPV
ncbi:hypothetical protein KQH65_09905 [archaeon]|nr:hypothetical protein [archaeon]